MFSIGLMIVFWPCFLVAYVIYIIYDLIKLRYQLKEECIPITKGIDYIDSLD